MVFSQQKKDESGFILLDVLHVWDEIHQQTSKLKKNEFYVLKRVHKSIGKNLQTMQILLGSLPLELTKKYSYVPFEELIKKIDVALSTNDDQLRKNLFWNLCKHQLPALEMKFELMFRDVGKKAHPLRVCPLGSYWVREHPRAVPKGVAVVEGHCRRNPSRSIKDHLYSTEIKRMSEKFYKNKTIIGNEKIQTFKSGVSNQYDGLIQGWVGYWNEVMQPDMPLPADIAKALIGSESGFKSKPRDRNNAREGVARGLFQLTDKTRSRLSNLKGEIKDHYIEINLKDVYLAENSVAAGIRWLFHKKHLAEHRLKRKITWEEAVADYKGLGRSINNKKYLMSADYKPFKDMLDSIQKK